jgi:hypothetical protein
MKKIFILIVFIFAYASYSSGFKVKTELVAPGTRSEGKRYIL